MPLSTWPPGAQSWPKAASYAEHWSQRDLGQVAGEFWGARLGVIYVALVLAPLRGCAS